MKLDVQSGFIDALTGDGPLVHPLSPHTVQTFGDRLTLEIERRGMTQRELARLLEVSPQAINGWVKGTSQPSWTRLLKLEDALGVPRGELMAVLGYQAPTDDGGPLVTLEDAIRADPGISAENKRALLRFVKLARAEVAEGD